MNKADFTSKSKDQLIELLLQSEQEAANLRAVSDNLTTTTQKR